VNSAPVDYSVQQTNKTSKMKRLIAKLAIAYFVFDIVTDILAALIVGYYLVGK